MPLKILLLLILLLYSCSGINHYLLESYYDDLREDKKLSNCRRVEVRVEVYSKNNYIIERRCLD